MNETTRNQQERWDAVDAYLAGLLAAEDEALSSTLRSEAEAGMPAIEVSATHAKLLHLLVRMSGARRVLEIGTLAGYSAIWMARALPKGGALITLEALPEHAAVARANIASAGLGGVVEVVEGQALDSLDRLVADGAEVFDLVFIDADKKNNPNYLERAMRLTVPGSVIVCDNVVRGGGVLDDAADAHRDVIGTRAFLEAVASDGRLEATAVQTVGAKGWDGFAVAYRVA